MDFSIPKRLDDGGFVVIGLLSFGRVLRAVLLPVLIVIFRSPQLFLQWKFWAIGAGISLLVFILAAIRHRYYRYYIDENEDAFILEKGVLSKTKVIVKFHNIQHINIKQNVIQQALDLYSMEIESAGSNGKEVDLYALDEKIALELKRYLSAKSLGQKDTALSGLSSNDATEADSSETVLAIPAKNILLVSLLSNYTQGLGIFLAFVIGLFDSLRDFISIDEMNDLYNGTQQNWSALLYEFLLIGLFILLIPLSINLFKYFISFYNFSVLRNAQGNLIMHFGLFQIQDIILNKHKVQQLAFGYNPILKRMGIGILSLYQINTDASKPGKATVLMPGINREGKQKIWEILFGRDVYQDLTAYKPERGLFISRMVKVLLLIVLLAGIAHWSGAGQWAYTGIGIVFVLMLLYNYVYYRQYRLFVSGKQLIKRDGFWDMQDQIVPVDKIISIAVSQSFFQRRFGTANLEISTPAGIVSLRFFKKSLILGLADQLLCRNGRK